MKSNVSLDTVRERERERATLLIKQKKVYLLYPKII